MRRCSPMALPPTSAVSARPSATRSTMLARAIVRSRRPNGRGGLLLERGEAHEVEQLAHGRDRPHPRVVQQLDVVAILEADEDLAGQQRVDPQLVVEPIAEADAAARAASVAV